MAYRSILVTGVFLMVVFGFRPNAFLCAQEERKPGSILLFDYRDASGSDEYISKQLVERIQHLCSLAVPNPQKSYPVRVVTAKTTDLIPFGANLSRNGREVLLTLPSRAGDWIANPEKTVKATAWLLAARMGLPPERGDRFLTAWPVHAIARKARFSCGKIQMPLSRFFPAAYALTSHGLYPTIGQVTNSFDGEYGTAVYDLNSEYAELLLDATQQEGLLREGLVYQTLVASLSLDTIEPEKLFLLLYDKIKLKRGAHVMIIQGHRDEVVNDWFVQKLRRLILSMFSPSATVEFEIRYHTASKAEYKTKDGGTGSCELRDIIANWNDMANGNEVIDEFLHRLNDLAFIAPPGFQGDIARLRNTLSQCRTDRKDSIARELQTAERSLFLAIQQYQKLEELLAVKQNLHVTPGARFMESARTFDAVLKNEKRLRPAVHALLDKWDDFR